MTDTNFNILKRDYLKFLNQINAVSNDFGGPSIYFHNRSLEEKKRNFLGESHIENIYATLTSWGMHRMGNTKTKMTVYNDFKNSILKQKQSLVELKDLKIQDLLGNKDDVLNELTRICFSFSVSISNSKIVGNSKTLAHILPDLVPPIDRQYTIRFFTNEPKSSNNSKGLYKTLANFNGIESEQKYFRHIFDKTLEFTQHIKNDKQVFLDNSFNTSYPKIFDNLIMAYIKSEKNIA